MKKRTIRDAVREHKAAKPKPVLAPLPPAPSPVAAAPVMPAQQPIATPTAALQATSPPKTANNQAREDKPPTAAVRKEKVKPPVVGTEILKAKCGHDVVFELFPDKADKYRERRREKVKEMDCKDCRTARHEARLIQNREDKAKRKEAKLAMRKELLRNQTVDDRGRLPHRSRITAQYDAEGKCWVGKMSIAIPDHPKRLVFRGKHTALFKLETMLDQDFRNWLNGRIAVPGFDPSKLKAPPKQPQPLAE